MGMKTKDLSVIQLLKRMYEHLLGRMENRYADRASRFYLEGGKKK